MGARGSLELNRDELARIYRALNPGQVYAGDPPEAWLRSVLLRQIRIILAGSMAGRVDV